MRDNYIVVKGYAPSLPLWNLVVTRFVDDHEDFDQSILTRSHTLAGFHSPPLSAGMV